MKTCAVALLVCLTVAAAVAQPLGDIKVVNDRAPDCSSLNSIVSTVTRGCQTDDEKVIAIYNFCRYVYYHYAYPTEEGGVSALKMMNVYGWGLCGGQHSVMAALWDSAGYPWRYRGWSNPGHTTVEVQYGGRWHYLDTFLKFYCWMPDPNHPGKQTIAGQLDIRANPSLVTDAFVMDEERKVCYFKDDRFAYVGNKVNWTAPAFMVCGDDLPGVLSGVRSSNSAGSPRGWASVQFDDPKYSTAINLAPGYSLTLDWDKVAGAWYFRGAKQSPRHTCGDKDYRNCPVIGPIIEPYAAKEKMQTWSNGTLVFNADLRNGAFLKGLKLVQNARCEGGKLVPQDADSDAVIVVEMSSPYVVARAAGKIAGEDAKAEISTDMKTWKPVDLAKPGDAVGGKYAYYVRITFRKPITAIELSSIVQHNQRAVPYLAPGKNTITVTAADGQSLGKNRLAITYAYCPGSRDATPEQVYDRGAEIARAHFAKWAEQPIVVQKIVDKLPCTFDILVPTPTGKQPVYPRMVFLRREVLAPGQSPAPVPAPPSTPKVGPNEQLATLPNPWTMGIHPPVPGPKRPTKTALLPVTQTSYASKKGEVFQHNFVKWLKDNSDAWILLVNFDVAKLPDLNDLAAAKLVLYVQEAHDKSPMQAAAVLLATPFEPGKPYDFAGLGQTLGSTIVAKGNGPGAPFVPPRRYEIDVTKAIRAWAGGAKCHGLAVRIVPNRGVDDGWTVRFTPAKEKPVELEIATYTGKAK